MRPAARPLRPLSRTVLCLPPSCGLCSGCPICVHAAEGEEPVPWLSFPSVQVAYELQGRPEMSLGPIDYQGRVRGGKKRRWHHFVKLSSTGMGWELLSVSL